MIQNRDLGDENDYIPKDKFNYMSNGLGNTFCMKYYKDFNSDKIVGYYFQRNDHGIYCCYMDIDEYGNYSGEIKYKLIKPIGLY